MLIAGALVAALGAPLAQAAGPGEQRREAAGEQRDVRRQIGRAEHDLEHSSARAEKAQARLTQARDALTTAREDHEAAEEKLAAARERDRRMQRKLREAKERLAQARSDVRAGERAVAEQTEAIEALVNNFYQQGDPQLLAIASVLRSEDPADLTRELEARKVILGAETTAYDELRAAVALLRERRAELADARADVARRREAAAAHLAEMKDLEAEARAAADRVGARVDDARQARERAARVRAADRRELRKLRRKEAAINREIKRLARGAKDRSAVPGALRRPVARSAYVTSRFGYRTHPIYGYYGLHNGVDFGDGGCGAPLFAAADARVMYRYRSSVWGNRLYLDAGVIQGRSVVLVYNHLRSAGVAPGQRVARGQRIGRMGNTGWSSGCHLHFTVLVNGRPTNPVPWM